MEPPEGSTLSFASDDGVRSVVRDRPILPKKMIQQRIPTTIRHTWRKLEVDLLKAFSLVSIDVGAVGGWVLVCRQPP